MSEEKIGERMAIVSAWVGKGGGGENHDNLIFWKAKEVLRTVLVLFLPLGRKRQGAFITRSLIGGMKGGGGVSVTLCRLLDGRRKRGRGNRFVFLLPAK